MSNWLHQCQITVPGSRCSASCTQYQARLLSISCCLCWPVLCLAGTAKSNQPWRTCHCGFTTFTQGSHTHLCVRMGTWPHTAVTCVCRCHPLPAGSATAWPHPRAWSSCRGPALLLHLLALVLLLPAGCCPWTPASPQQDDAACQLLLAADEQGTCCGCGCACCCAACWGYGCDSCCGPHPL